MKDLALHVCCAPCLAAALETLRREGKSAAGIIFFNPNIHPLLEFRRRVKALGVYLRLPADVQEQIGPQLLRTN